MPIELRNISSIAPNGAGTITVPGTVNLTGTPAPTFQINGVPIGSGGGGAQTPWLSDINAAGFRLYGTGRVLIGTSTDDGASMLQVYTTAAATISQVSNGGPSSLVKLSVYSDSGNGYGGQFFGYAARGTQAAPTVTQAGDWLLDLRGHGYDGSAFTNAAEIRFQADTAFSSGAGSAVISFSTAGGGGAMERMRISSDGRVGVGQSAPITMFDVQGPTIGPGISYFKSTDQHCWFNLDTTGTTGSAGYEFNIDGGWAGEISYTLTGGMAFWSRNATIQPLTISPTGNVGISVPSPASALDIAGQIRNRFTAAPGAGMWLDSSSNVNVAFVGMNDLQNQWRIYSALTFTNMVMADLTTGNVGIGMSPQQRLSVSGGDDTVVNIYTVGNIARIDCVAASNPGAGRWTSINQTLGPIAVGAPQPFDPGYPQLAVWGGLTVTSSPPNGLACIRRVSMDQLWGVGEHFPANTWYLFATALGDPYGGWARWLMIFDLPTGNATMSGSLNVGSVTATGNIQCNGTVNAAAFTINGQPLAFMAPESGWTKYDLVVNQYTGADVFAGQLSLLWANAFSRFYHFGATTYLQVNITLSPAVSPVGGAYLRVSIPAVTLPQGNGGVGTVGLQVNAGNVYTPPSGQFQSGFELGNSWIFAAGNMAPGDVLSIIGAVRIT